MTVKDFFIGVAELPATILSGIAGLLLGSTEKDKKGQLKENNGLLGLILDFVKAGGRSIANFLTAHKVAISIAAWSTLLIGGGLALTLFLWPAALAAVANFSVYGFSIAGIAGAEPLMQIGLAFGLAAGVISAVTYTTAAIVNTCIAIKDCIYPPDETGPEDQPEDDEDADVAAAAVVNKNQTTTSHQQMRQLHSTDKIPAAAKHADVAPPHQTASLHQKPATASQERLEEDEEDLNTSHASLGGTH